MAGRTIDRTIGPLRRVLGSSSGEGRGSTGGRDRPSRYGWDRPDRHGVFEGDPRGRPIGRDHRLVVGSKLTGEARRQGMAGRADPAFDRAPRWVVSTTRLDSSALEGHARSVVVRTLGHQCGQQVGDRPAATTRRHERSRITDLDRAARAGRAAPIRRPMVGRSARGSQSRTRESTPTIGGRDRPRLSRSRRRSLRPHCG